MSGERRGRPLAAFGIVLLILAVTALLGLWAALALTGAGGLSSNTNVGQGLLFAVLAFVCLIGGIWWAIQVGSDYSGLGARHMAPPAPPPPIDEAPPAPRA